MVTGIASAKRRRVVVGTTALLGMLVPVFAAVPGCGQRPKAAPVQAHAIRTVSLEEAQQFAGSAACATCHVEESKAHVDSHHAHALTRITADADGERFRHPSDIRDKTRGLAYRTGVLGGDCVLSVLQGGREEVVKATLGFGSGKHATTFMGPVKGDLLELRLSHYAAARRWDFSPGQQEKRISGGVLYPLGLVKAPQVVEECFVCHSTAVVKEDGRVLPDASILGVGCESCHGPGKAHIAAVNRRDADLRMPRLSALTPQASTKLCGQCHRSPVSEDIHDPFNRIQLPRLQGLALTQSACFRNSEGRMSCLTCHDPHGDSKATEAEYDQKCRSCHSGSVPEQPPCPIDPTKGCVSCHMPKQGVDMPTGLKYRTHWIKVWAAM